MERFNIVNPYFLSIEGYEPHTNVYNQTMINGFHEITCEECDIRYVESHIMSDYVYNDTTHSKFCECCSYTSINYHALSYEYISETLHSKVCDCGYNAEVSHNYEYTPYSSTQHVSYCPDCDNSIYQNHEWVFKIVTPSTQGEVSPLALVKKYYCKQCGMLKV